MTAKSLTTQAIYLVGYNLFRYSLAFFVPVFLVRLLTVNEYGIYRQLTLLGTLVSSLLGMGISFSIYYFFNTLPKEKRKSLVLQTFLLLLSAGIIGYLVILLMSAKISVQFSNDSLRTLLPIYGGIVLFELCCEYFMPYHVVSEGYARGIAFELAFNMVRVVVMVLSAMQSGLVGMVVCLLIFSVCRCVTYNAIVWKDIRKWSGHEIDFSLLKSQLAYSLPLGFNRMIGYISGATDKLIIASFYKPEKYAIYATGAIELPFDTIFQGSVADVLRSKIPSLYEAKKIGDIILIWKNSVRKLSLVIAPFFGYFLFFSKDLIPLIFTKSYADSTIIFQIYLFIIPTHALPCSVIPLSTGKTMAVSWISIVTIFFNIIFSIMFIKLLGYYGPAVACNLSAYVSSFLYIYISSKILGIKMFSLFPLRNYTFMFIGSAVISMACWNGRNLIGGFSGLIAGTCVFFIITYIYYYIIGSLLRKDVDFILEKIRWKIA